MLSDLLFNLFKRQCSQGLGAQTGARLPGGVRIQAWLCDSCVTLGRVLNFSDAQLELMTSNRCCEDSREFTMKKV